MRMNLDASKGWADRSRHVDEFLKAWRWRHHQMRETQQLHGNNRQGHSNVQICSDALADEISYHLGKAELCYEISVLEVISL